MTLYRKRVFADVIKDFEMRSSWIRVGPKSSDKCPYKRRPCKDTQRIMLCEDEGRNCTDGFTS